MKTIKAKYGLDMEKAPGLTLQQMDEVRTTLERVIFRDITAPINATADSLGFADMATSLTGGNPAEQIKLQFTDGNANGISAATLAALGDPANYVLRYNNVGPWNTITPTSITVTVINANTVNVTAFVNAVPVASGAALQFRTTGALGTDTTIVTNVTNVYLGTAN